jgi:hypothetical protein
LSDKKKILSYFRFYIIKRHQRVLFFPARARNSYAEGTRETQNILKEEQASTSDYGAKLNIFAQPKDRFSPIASKYSVV